MHLLAVPNWSFGRDSDLLRQFAERLDRPELTLHYLSSDVDHNRTVSAFAGQTRDVADALLDLCRLAFPRIDLNRHSGVHPRIGALDVCPIVDPSGGADAESMQLWVTSVALSLADEFEVPVFLYEKSEQGRHEADLPTLRRGGFGTLLERELKPDFGPSRAHPRLGATVMGWREFLIAINVDLDEPDAGCAQETAKKIRDLRSEGDHRFLGVRALGLPLPSRNQSQVSLNVTLPDVTPLDPIIEWVRDQAGERGVRTAGIELVGVLRDVDMEHATSLAVRPEQVVSTR